MIGSLNLRRLTWSRFLIFNVVALTVLLVIVWSSPEWRPSITSALKTTYDWGASQLPASTDHENDVPPPPEQTQDKGTEDKGTQDKGTQDNGANAPPPSQLTTLLSALFEPLKLSVTAPSWTDADGKKFELPKNPVWTKPLGKRLCIIDIDTRPLNDTNQIMNTDNFSWTQYGVTSAGMLGHYLYAQIHGYDYKFVRTHNFEDRSAYWTKISALSDTLRDYEFVISIDADAQIQHPEIPFEWLLNRWGVKKETALTLTIDPDIPVNRDPKGRPNNNCGFVVGHNIPRTHQMLKTWASCPDEPLEEFKGCARWKNPWPAEQAAFGEYIRYMFNETNDLNEIPCDEANGFPESNTACTGRFVRHLWTSKQLTKDVISNSVMHVLFKQLHDQFIGDDSIVVERMSNDFTRDSS